MAAQRPGLCDGGGQGGGCNLHHFSLLHNLEFRRLFFFFRSAFFRMFSRGSFLISVPKLPVQLRPTQPSPARSGVLSGVPRRGPCGADVQWVHRGVLGEVAGRGPRPGCARRRPAAVPERECWAAGHPVCAAAVAGPGLFCRIQATMVLLGRVVGEVARKVLWDGRK